MKPAFHHRLVNGRFEDPTLYVRIPWQKRALLFDAGDLRNLSPSEFQKITDVFVTHTHIDHFIGFDSLLRALLRRKMPLNVYGPPAITRCVEGKLRGYEWNLIRDYPMVVNVYAFSGKTLTYSVFRAADRFRRAPVSRVPCTGVLVREPLFRVTAAKMDHDTSCLAYALEEEQHINIDKDALEKRGLPIGPWLNQFKEKLRAGAAGPELIAIQGREYRIADLRDIAAVSEGGKICYATDIAMTKKNLAALVGIASDSDVFYCEAFFLERDRALALARHHLTAKTAGAVAREARVKRLVLTHTSPRYTQCPEAVEQEAMQEIEKSL